MVLSDFFPLRKSSCHISLKLHQHFPPEMAHPHYSDTTHWLTLVHLQIDLHSFNVFIQYSVHKYLFIYLFIFILFNLFYFWLRWVFVAVRRLSLVAASGGYSSLQCTGFSLQWPLLLWSMGSRHAGLSSCGLRALERRLSSCGAWA